MSARLRVLFVTPFGLHRRGTVAHRILPLATALAQQGVEVRVAIAGWDTPADRRTIRTELPLDLVHIPFPADLLQRGEAGKGLVWLHMVRWVHTHVRAWRPDVIHLSKPVTVPFLFLAWARAGGRRVRVPIVLDCDDLERAWVEDVPWARLWRRLGSRLEAWAWRAADGVTAASHFLLDQIARARGNGRVWWLPNALPPLQFVEGAHDHPRLIVPTRLLDIRPEVLVEWLAAALVAVSRGNVLVVGPNRARAALLLEALERVGLRGRIAVVVRQRLRGYVDLLAGARVGLYAVEDTPATRAKCPRRVLDMMAVGLPVVAVDVGEPRWLLADTGLVVPAQGEAIAAAVADLWQDEARRARLGRRAYGRARREFARARVGKKLLAVYEEVRAQ